MKQNPTNNNQTPKHVYPEATLSDKSLEALHKVIGSPSKPDDNVQSIINDVKADINAEPGFLKDMPYESTQEQQTAALPEIVMKDRSVVRTVFLVIFIVLLITAAGVGGWYYWWTTHATFEHTLHPVVILEGQHITPGDFLYSDTETGGINAEFQDPGFDPFIGMQYVQLKLSLGLRSMDAAAALYVLTPRESIEHEFAAEGTTLRAVDMLLNPEVAANVPFDVHFSEAPLPLEEYEVGEHILHLVLNDVPFTVLLTVSDTTPPIGLAVHVEEIIGEEVFPDAFVTDTYDASGISSVEFESEPNIFLISDEPQIVRIVITDNNGNSETISSSLTLLLNETPPVIEGVSEVFEVKINTQVDYFAGVTAYDSFYRPLELNVTDFDVDTSRLGTYSAIIWVADITGNISEVEVAVHIINIDPDDFFKRIDDILERLLNDRMTQAEKAREIHNWIRSRMQKSTASSDSQSLIEVALPAISESPGDRRGNSFVYSAISSIMLTRAGIENMLINRIESAETMHRWVLINPDDKGWHHFDPFPTGMVLGNLTAMFTEKEANEIARRAKHNFNIDDYYTFNKELFPEIVKE